MLYDPKALPKWLKIPSAFIGGVIIIWLTVQIIWINNASKPAEIPSENAVQCEAVITDVVHYSTKSGRNTGTYLHIRYTFEDTEYNEVIFAGFAVPTMKAGDTLQLTVDKTNPHYAVINDESRPVDFFTVMVIFVIAGIAIVAALILTKKLKEKNTY